MRFVNSISVSWRSGATTTQLLPMALWPSDLARMAHSPIHLNMGTLCSFPQSAEKDGTENNRCSCSRRQTQIEGPGGPLGQESM